MKPIVQSLWVGSELSELEKYSIRSFLNTGHEFHLYTYEKVKGVPEGTKICDANEIMKYEDVFTLKEQYLPFSDIWRYKMLYEKGNYWADVDMIAIKTLDFKEPYVFSSERTIQRGAFKMTVPLVPNIGILKAPKGSEFYLELYNLCIETQNRGKNKDKIKYMRLLRKMIEKFGYSKYVKKPDFFCHLDWWHAKDAYMHVPEFAEKYGVKGKSVNSMFTGKNVYTVHLWRNLATHKYKLDLNGEFPPMSFFEMAKVYIDTGKVPKFVGPEKKSRKKTKKKTRD